MTYLQRDDLLEIQLQIEMSMAQGRAISGDEFEDALAAAFDTRRLGNKAAVDVVADGVGWSCKTYNRKRVPATHSTAWSAAFARFHPRTILEAGAPWPSLRPDALPLTDIDLCQKAAVKSSAADDAAGYGERVLDAIWADFERDMLKYGLVELRLAILIRFNDFVDYVLVDVPLERFLPARGTLSWGRFGESASGYDADGALRVRVYPTNGQVKLYPDPVAAEDLIAFRTSWVAPPAMPAIDYADDRPPTRMVWAA